MSARASGGEVGDRRYLREKIVSTYESLWAGAQLDDRSWDELFQLKVRADVLQQQVSSLPPSTLRNHHTTFRRLFAECCRRMGAQHEPSTQSHAMETLGGLLLGLGCRPFHDFQAEALDLLCGIDTADAVFAALGADVRRLLARDGPAAPALQRSAVRLLLCLCSAADNLDQNILVELTGVGALTPALAELVVDDATAAGVREDAMRVAVLFASYHRRESRNACLALLTEGAAKSAAVRALASSARAVFDRCLFPASTSATSALLGPALAHSVVSWTSYFAHKMTLESLLPTSLSRQLSGSETLREHAAPLASALLLCWELIGADGGAAFGALCEATPGAPGGAAPTRRAELLRNVLSTVSTLGCVDARRDDLALNLTRLGLHIVDSLLAGATRPPPGGEVSVPRSCRELLLTADLGAGLPLWRLAGGQMVQHSGSSQPLLGAALEIVTDVISQNLRRGGFPAAVPLYAHALHLLHRLLLLVVSEQIPLPLLPWSALYGALFSAAAFVSEDDLFALAGVPPLGLQLLSLINTCIALGDRIFPSAAIYEAFAYELVRRHRTFEKLYKLGKRQAAEVVGALALARSVIVQALEALDGLGADAAAAMTAPQALAIVRKLQVNVPAKALGALQRAPPPPSPHEQASFRQLLLRHLLARSRVDGSLAPVAFEEPIAESTL